ncbi:SDR family oxidoreductase [Devosia rhizoryzae]|uniref:SDR family oxidoreductase n=1 Tax=Devosia rhizoryzae TaxID=2774137 RepID=A0ABX7C4Y7_9HYPH|nr:SDR family oxidoreductase [Devosia rhizoryzae]QQR39307.1 SDR family oxidoreductase [Devosia rhizoryzae]
MSGRVALVTGATSGIGRATVIGLAAAGYRVAALGRRDDALQSLASDHPIAFAQACDVTDRKDVARYFAAMQQALGRLDVVFNNAGRSAPTANFGDIDPHDWDGVIDVNLTGAFNIAHAAFRAMRDQNPQGGRIINNGSISAHVPRPHAAAYTVSKHAITGLTKAISLDGRACSIACGQIDIGNVATDMTAAMTGGVLQPDGRTMPEPTFELRHVVDAVLYMAGLPLEANVQFMTVMATNMPFIGRG